MNLVIKCRKIIGGLALGQALVTRQPINFLTMLDPETGIVHDSEHELYGSSLKSKVLVFPNAIGSTVGAYAFYSLKVKGLAPEAVICTNIIDIITASACAISDIPAVDMKGQPSDSTSLIKPGIRVLVDADSRCIKLSKDINL